MDARVIAAVKEHGVSSKIKEIFLACYDQIISRKIVSLSGLTEYVDDLGWHPDLERVVRKCDRLIREINWGILRDLDREQFPGLWKSLVVPNRKYRDLGDLKINIQVPNTYCALLDIHAYTDFCEQHRHNFSMLKMLDDLIENDIKEIARKNHCLSHRSAGDNILLIGSLPNELLTSCLAIIDCFSRRRVLKDASLSEARTGTSIVLQDLHVTAGIAGGLNYSSMVITQDGDISGNIVNTAARLQSFANSLSPQKSKVMVTSPVCAGILRAKQEDPQEGTRAVNHGFDFFSCGKIQFKGVGISVYEVLYTEKELRKLRYQKEYRRLLNTMGKGLWKERLIPDALGLVMRVLKTTPVPRSEIVSGGKKEIYTTASLIKLCENLLDSYQTDRGSRLTSLGAQKVLGLLESTNGFDDLVLLHFRQIVALFEQMTRDYESAQYEKVMTNQDSLFSIEERKILDSAHRMEEVRERLINRGKQNNNIYSPGMLWNKIIDDYEKNWEFEIYSGKQ